MAFVEVERSGFTKVNVPPKGAVIGSRAAGRKGQISRYLAVTIGKDAAKELGLHMAKQNVLVQRGVGEDEGKIAISCEVKAKFVATKRAGGEYLITITGLPDAWTNVTKHTVDPVRLVPARGTTAPMVILKLPNGG